MNITIMRAESGLKLYSYNPEFRKYVNQHRSEYADYHSRNYTGNEIYCYDISLFEVMGKISDHFNNVENEAVTFDVE